MRGILVVLLSSVGVMHAADQDPLRRTSHQFVVKQVLFEVRATEFTPPLAVPVDGPAARDPRVAVAARVLAAMQAGDFEQWLATWDEPGRRFYRERLAGAWGDFEQRTAQDWKQGWETLLAGADAYITALAQAPSFALVAYEFRRPDASAPLAQPGFESSFTDEGVLRGRLALVREGEQWVQTGRFGAHPVFLGWRTGRDGVPVPATETEWGVETPWPPKK
jgi:hypothetical protein